MPRSSCVITEARSVTKLFSVIGVPGEERCGAVDLLAEHHLRECVWQRERREAQQQRGLLLDRRVQSVGAADHEYSRLAEQRGELPGSEVPAALIEGNQAQVPRNLLPDFPCLFGFELHQRHLVAARHAPEIFVAGACGPGRKPMCDGDEGQPCPEPALCARGRASVLLSSSVLFSSLACLRPSASLPCRPRALPGCSSCAPPGA